jgi:fluoride exporter
MLKILLVIGTGSFIGGIARFLTGQLMKLFLTVGICGGFTTFSTFSIEGMTLLKGGNVFMFLLYSSLSVIFGLVATWLGYISLRAVQI